MTWLSLAFDPLKGHGFFLVHDETQALLTPAKLHSDLDLRFSVLLIRFDFGSILFIRTSP